MQTDFEDAPGDSSLQVMYSTPDPTDVARFVSRHYDTGRLDDCQLLRRGFNDVYRVRAGNGAQYILRLGGRRLRETAGVEYETRFLEHLDRCGVPVAAAVPSVDGRLWHPALTPEGTRIAVLFRFLPGRPAQRGSRPDAYAQGVTLAQVHLAGRSFHPPGEPLALDMEHLLVQPADAVRSLPFVDRETAACIDRAVERLSEHLLSIRGGLARGHCHGDCHGLNARIAETGVLDRTAAFFDFDDGGPGWLAYDLAVYLWNKALNRETLDLWPPFLEGYRSVHRIPAVDLEAALLFVPIRHVWLVRQYADRLKGWGTEAVPPRWFEAQGEFLRDWERRYLSPERLL